LIRIGRFLGIATLSAALRPRFTARFVPGRQLPGGRTLAEVPAAAGLASLVTTRVYLHIVVDDAGEVGLLLGAV
jgi:hypothetical protein